MYVSGDEGDAFSTRPESDLKKIKAFSKSKLFGEIGEDLQTNVTNDKFHYQQTLFHFSGDTETE